MQTGENWKRKKQEKIDGKSEVKREEHGFYYYLQIKTSDVIRFNDAQFARLAGNTVHSHFLVD